MTTTSESGKASETVPTNGELVRNALKALGPGWHTSREVMWEVRRAGYQMTTARARGICRFLYRNDKAHMLVYNGRYSFEIKEAPESRPCRND